MITEEQVKEKTLKRFWEKIKFGRTDECWLWTFAKDPNGYGRFGVRITDRIIPKGKKTFKCILAHKFMYDSIFHKLFKPLCACHTCDNPTCVNPNHLFEGTQKDNADDKVKKGRLRYGNSYGSEHGMAKLTEEKVMIIKMRLLYTDESNRSLARSFNVDQKTIYNIKKDIIWRQVKIV